MSVIKATFKSGASTKAPAYKELATYRIMRSEENGQIYLSWYAPSENQTKRAGLKTDDLVTAWRDT